jgi:hypothetical protein
MEGARGTTNESVSPDLGHVHPLRMPDVRLEPDLVLCRAFIHYNRQPSPMGGEKEGENPR